MIHDQYLLDVAAGNGKPQRLVELHHATAGDYRDTINPNSARSRETFIKGAAKKLHVDPDSLAWLRDELPLHADQADAKLEDMIGDDHDDGEKKSTSDLLVELALSRYQFGRTDSDDAFAVEIDGPNVALMFRGSREALRAKLSRQYRESHGRIEETRQQRVKRLLAADKRITTGVKLFDYQQDSRGGNQR